MKIFLSYSSTDQNIVEPVYYELLNSGHEVFIDRKSLLPAEEFNSVIRKSVHKSDLFIFMISPDSVKKSAYTHTELRFAEEKWPHPKGHVLPVMLQPTDYALIPNYLKAINILESEGNLAAEVGAWVALKRQAKHKKLLYTLLPLIAVILILLLVIFRNFINMQPSPQQNVRDAQSGNSQESLQPRQTTAQPTRDQADMQLLQSFDEPYTEIPDIWQDSSDDIWSSRIKDGRYCLTNTTHPGNVRYVWQQTQPASNPQDMRASVYVELLQPDYQAASSSAGLIYSFNPGNRYYYSFTISSDGKFHFYKKNAAGLNLIYSSTYDDDLSGTPIMLSMQRKQDGLLALSINDELVKTIQDDELAPGEYGIAGMGSGEFCFDNLMANLPD